MNLFSPGRRVQRVRHELLAREVRVSHIEAVSPGFLDITFAGESLSSFVSLSFDDHVKLMLADASGAMHRRDFTPLHFNLAKRELMLQFALHERGVACQWARQARVGDSAVIGGPRGSMVVPTDYDWHLLAGDATALPAIQRRLQELPQGARAQVLLHVDHAADHRVFKSQAALDVQWFATPDALVQAIRHLRLPAGDGFAWCAGEATCMAQVRDVLLGERQLPREASRISAYWKAGAADFHEAHG